MAVFSKKYDKYGTVDIRDYVIFMCEAIEFYASTVNKRVSALEKENEKLKKEIQSLKETRYEHENQG